LEELEHSEELNLAASNFRGRHPYGWLPRAWVAADSGHGSR
jgi:hypothetical protein